MGRVIKLDNDIDYIRKELDELQTRVKSFNVSTQYAISNSDTVAPSTGWQDEKPSTDDLEAGDFIWVRNTLHTSYGNIVLEPYCIGDGVPHIIDIKILYMQSNDPYQAPSPTNINWSETAPTLEAGYYMYSMTVITTTEGETRSSPVRITGEKGDSGNAINIKGDAGKGYDFIYWTDNTAPSTPEGEVTRHNGQVEAWCDYPTPVDATHKYIYMSLRTSDKIGEWGDWTDPVLMSTIGEKGQDGEGFEIIFYQSQTEVNWSDINTNQNPSKIPTDWTGNDNGTSKDFQDADFYLESQGWNDDSQGVDSTYRYEYASHRTKSVNSSGVGSWEAFTTPVLWNTYAEDGESTYLHIRYSNVLDPTNSSQVHVSPSDNTYSIGTCVDNTEETDANRSYYNNPSLYSWSKWIPKQGVDYDGKFVFIRYADDNEGTNMNTTSGAYLGICYSEVNEEPPASAYTWNKILGDAGEGMNFIYYTTSDDNYTTTPVNPTIHHGNDRGVDKWCDVPVSVSEYTPYCYVSTKPSTSTTWNAPSLWAKYGLNGNNGNHGTGYEFAFYTSSSAPTGADATPHDISNSGDTESWQSSVVSVDATHTKVYVSYRTKTGSQYSDWSEPTVLSEKGDRGAIGYDGKGIEMIFLATSTEIDWSSIVSGATNIDGNQVVNPANENTSTDAYQRYPQEYVPTGWSDDPVDISEQKPYLYSSIRIRTNNIWGAFDQPTLFTKFQKGEDGKGIEFIFRATATNTAPNFTYGGKNQGIKTYTGTVNGKHYNDDDFVPNNWADDPITPTASLPFVWVSQRTSSDGQWSNFSTPTIWSQKEVKSIETWYYLSSSNTELSDGTWSTTKQTYVEGKYYWTKQKFTFTDNSTEESDPICATGEKGEKGDKGDDGSGYQYAYYTTSLTTPSPTKPNGNPSTSNQTGYWNATPVAMDSTNKYMFVSYRTKTGSTYGSWTNGVLFSRFGEQGEQGIQGERGKTILTVTGCPAYNERTVDGVNYYYQKTKANILSESGASEVKVGDYVKCNNYLYKVDYVGSTWVLFIGRTDLKGETGETGARGQDGIGMEHIFYLSDEEILDWRTMGNLNPQNWTTTNTDEYIENDAWTDDATGVDAENMWEYVSIRTKTVDDVETGIGTWNAYGEPSLWAKYGERGTAIITATGTFTAYTGSNTSYKYQTTQSDIVVGDTLRKDNLLYPVLGVSGNTVYTGNPINLKGATGNAGTSVKAIVNYYAVSSSNTSSSGLTWVTDPSQVELTEQNCYLWNYEIAYSHETLRTPTYEISTTTPCVIGTYGEKGDTGSAGKGILSIVEEYALSTNTSSTGLSWKSTVQTPTPTNRFLWNRETINYTTGQPYVSSPRIIGVYGATGETGERGYSILTVTSPVRNNTEQYACDGTVYPYRKSKADTLSESGASEVKVGDYVLYNDLMYHICCYGSSQIYFDTVTELRGTDGVAPTLDEVASEVEDRIDVENLDAKTLGQKSADEYLLVEPSYADVTQTTSGAKIEYRKLGILVIINIFNWVVRCTETSTSGWEYFRTDSTSNSASFIYAPQGHRPSTDLIVGGGTTGANHNKDMAIRLDQDGRFRIKRISFNTSTVDETETVSGTFVFFADNRASTTVSSTIGTFYCGDELVVTLKRGNTNLSGRTVNIEVNNVLYQRTTDSNGQATLKLNNPMSNVQYRIRFMGDKDYATSNLLTGEDLTVSKDTEPELDVVSQLDVVHYTDTANFFRTTPFKGRVTNQNGKGLKDITVRVDISAVDYGGSSFSGVTDSDGFFTIYHPNDGAIYNNTKSYLCTFVVVDNVKCGGITQEHTITFRR